MGVARAGVARDAKMFPGGEDHDGIHTTSGNLTPIVVLSIALSRHDSNNELGGHMGNEEFVESDPVVMSDGQ